MTKEKRKQQEKQEIIKTFLELVVPGFSTSAEICFGY